jgi:hypothetical protein
MKEHADTLIISVLLTKMELLKETVSGAVFLNNVTAIHINFRNFFFGWFGTKSFVTAAIYWPIVTALDDDCGATSGMNEWRGKPRYSEITCSNAALSITDPMCDNLV